jgi:hypothetical protein
MAKVEKVEREVVKPKWEPFATVTLSKREAAGVAALLSKASSGVATYALYAELDVLLGGTNDYGDELCVTGSSNAIISLDNRFGKL